MIIKRKDGYHVLSEEGKNLGGPYPDEEQAKERLAQVHYFKYRGKAAEYIDKLAKERTRREVVEDLGAGAAAGVAATLATFPIDVVSDAQKPGNAIYDGWKAKDIAKDIYKTRGLKGFFKGSPMKVLKIAPASAISFAAYEGISKELKKHRANKSTAISSR